jgi:hypothetical protein
MIPGAGLILTYGLKFEQFLTKPKRQCSILIILAKTSIV